MDETSHQKLFLTGEDLMKKYLPRFSDGARQSDIDNFFGEAYGRVRAENNRRYTKLVSITEGFDGGNWTYGDLILGLGGSGGSMVMSCETGGQVELAARFAFKALNILNILLGKAGKEECLYLEEVIRATAQLICGLNYFITIKASDGNYYEAKVYVDLYEQFNTIFIRSAKHYPVTDPEILQLQKGSESAGGSGSVGDFFCNFAC